MGYREQLNECTDPVSGDWLEITNTGNATDKEQKVNAGKFGILANTATWTATQTFTPAVGAYGIVITTPTNQSFPGIYVGLANNGTSYGPYIVIDRNNNGSTPASGFIQIVNRTGTGHNVWVDSSGNLRIGTTAPTNAQDTSGSVVGAQTSYVGLKTDITEWTDTTEALNAVLSLPLFSYKFKSGDGRQYRGIVIDDVDRGAWFSENDAENQLPSLNERNLFGYLIGAVQALSAQIEALKAEVEKLRSAH